MSAQVLVRVVKARRGFASNVSSVEAVFAAGCRGAMIWCGLGDGCARKSCCRLAQD